MTDQTNSLSGGDASTFAWHPEYKGRSVDSVRRELIDRIRRDQAAYQLALESAEKEEHDAFATVRDLEKRWSTYDFAWFELPPEQLADRILRFEQERDTRQEMITWQSWRSTSASVVPGTGAPGKRDWRENLSDDQRKRIASALAVGVLVLGLLVCIGLYLLVR